MPARHTKRDLLIGPAQHGKWPDRPGPVAYGGTARWHAGQTGLCRPGPLLIFRRDVVDDTDPWNPRAIHRVSLLSSIALCIGFGGTWQLLSRCDHDFRDGGPKEMVVNCKFQLLHG